MSSDQILITGLKLDSRIGVDDWERQVDQQLVLNLRLQPAGGFAKAAQSDDIGQALNYAAVSDCLVKRAAQCEYQLIEALAEDLVAQLFEQFPMVEKVGLELRKPAVVDAAEWVGLSLERSR